MENQTVNINEMTDLKELKSLAYDEMVKRELADLNLAKINTRIAAVSEEQNRTEAED